MLPLEREKNYMKKKFSIELKLKKTKRKKFLKFFLIYIF